MQTNHLSEEGRGLLTTEMQFLEFRPGAAKAEPLTNPSDKQFHQR